MSPNVLQSNATAIRTGCQMVGLYLMVLVRYQIFVNRCREIKDSLDGVHPIECRGCFSELVPCIGNSAESQGIGFNIVLPVSVARMVHLPKA